MALAAGHSERRRLATLTMNTLDWATGQLATLQGPVIFAAKEVPHGPCAEVPERLNKIHALEDSVSYADGSSSAGCPDKSLLGSGAGPLAVMIFGE